MYVQLMETSNQMSMDLERLLNHNQVHVIHAVYCIEELIIHTKNSLLHNINAVSIEWHVIKYVVLSFAL